MRRKALSLTSTISCIALLFASVSFADIPAPPVNQSLGFPDTIFNNLVEAECRVCHEDPGHPVPTSIPDRHHLLYGSALPQGECSVNRSNACLSDADCDAGICSRSPAETCTLGLCDSSEDSCNVLADCTNTFDTACSGPSCDDAGLGETCGEVCIGETVAPDIDANGDTVNDTVYSCLSCHEQRDVGGVITFEVERDCLQCHLQIPGEGSVHHLTPTAQGTRDPIDDIGTDGVGDCTPCHGTVVDDIGDGHVIPLYSPSLVTPKPSGGNGDPDNSEGNGAGACDYCHSTGTGDPVIPGSETPSGVLVYGNSVNHHNTGVDRSETGDIEGDRCLWCHAVPYTPNIRTCEGCHGLESLHNIQTDAEGCTECIPGQEPYGYGHVGADNPGTGSDCWGCHGFGMSSASAPGLGPITPSINSAVPVVTIAGTDTVMTVDGASFTNWVGSTYKWTSIVVLTAADDSTIELTPDAIDACSLTVTVPGSTPVGNYDLRAVKGDSESNAVGISVKPPVAISGVSCKTTCSLSTMTIAGSGFGDAPPEGADEYINVLVDGALLDIISWTDTEIKASSTCSGPVTVNALYGSAIH
jgi:hypothetical protein